MKKIFPRIAVFISLSLIGLIYFQYTWLSTSLKTKEKQLKESIFISTTEAAEALMESKSSLMPIQKKRLEAKEDKNFRMNILRPSVIQRYTKDEIHAVIRTSMNKHLLEDADFEFAVTENSLTGDQVQSDRFFTYYADSANNTSVVVPLLPLPGSDWENISKEEYLVVIVPNQKSIVYREIFWLIFGIALFTLIIFTAFFITIRALVNQKKLSEIKSDFINNMTHEFKTPLATISLAVDSLKNEKVQNNPEKTGYFIHIIKEENKRMNKQVEAILQAALLDKNEVQLNRKLLSVHDIINRALMNVSLSLEEKGGKADASLKATVDMVEADEVHLTNVVTNLLDNAIKYAKPEGPGIHISTEKNNQSIKIRIKDEGIGMSRDTLQRVFEKFYRAHTGNLHNVKGFGLGLSYVKSIVEAHGGQIKAESTLGQGSTFSITLPLAR